MKSFDANTVISAKFLLTVKNSNAYVWKKSILHLLNSLCSITCTVFLFQRLIVEAGNSPARGMWPWEACTNRNEILDFLILRLSSRWKISDLQTNHFGQNYLLKNWFNSAPVNNFHQVLRLYFTSIQVNFTLGTSLQVKGKLNCMRHCWRCQWAK